MISAAELSSYEKKRAENVTRNNARLRALGLISALEEEKSNAKAWGKEISESCDQQDESKKRKQKKIPSPQEPIRKSRRLLGERPEHAARVDQDESRSHPSSQSALVFETEEERQARVKECREARQRAAIEVAKAGANAAGKENRSATYEHCLMRVKTMTDKALTNRVKAIERAAGKHCVVKMAIFKSCLQDEGMWDLAKLASEALERLKALQPPPEE
jgi:hypothetical protein